MNHEPIRNLGLGCRSHKLFRLPLKVQAAFLVANIFSLTDAPAPSAADARNAAELLAKVTSIMSPAPAAKWHPLQKFKAALVAWPAKQVAAKSPAFQFPALYAWDDNVVMGVLKLIFATTLSGTGTGVTNKIPGQADSTTTAAVDAAVIALASVVGDDFQGNKIKAISPVDTEIARIQYETKVNYPVASAFAPVTVDPDHGLVPEAYAKFKTALQATFCLSSNCDNAETGEPDIKTAIGDNINYIYDKESAPKEEGPMLGKADMKAFAAKFVNAMRSGRYGKASEEGADAEGTLKVSLPGPQYPPPPTLSPEDAAALWILFFDQNAPPPAETATQTKTVIKAWFKAVDTNADSSLSEEELNVHIKALKVVQAGFAVNGATLDKTTTDKIDADSKALAKTVFAFLNPVGNKAVSLSDCDLFADTLAKGDEIKKSEFLAAVDAMGKDVNTQLGRLFTLMMPEVTEAKCKAFFTDSMKKVDFLNAVQPAILSPTLALGVHNSIDTDPDPNLDPITSQQVNKFCGDLFPAPPAKQAAASAMLEIGLGGHTPPPAKGEPATSASLTSDGFAKYIQNQKKIDTKDVVVLYTQPKSKQGGGLTIAQCTHESDFLTITFSSLCGAHHGSLYTTIELIVCEA